MRDGTDYSANASYEIPVAGGELRLSGAFVRTDRYQDEDSIEYLGGVENAANLSTVNDNELDIRTDNLSLAARFERCIGEDTHEAHVAGTINDADALLGEGLPYFTGGSGVSGVEAFVGAAENGDGFHCLGGYFLFCYKHIKLDCFSAAR